ncbi:MAG: arsenic resistance protein [Methylobacterium sp. SCN 67-24]|nr:MAG: arsenic resistance protein [Methylobacterium sp. SCN 67-24]
MGELRDRLESRQVLIYFAAVGIAAIVAILISGTERLEPAINPALALMLFVTFLQVPVASLRKAFRNGRFFGALLAVNFIAVPVLVALIIQFAPPNPLVRLGVLLVLLCPCIDYVVTFSHVGRADARLLLAATPVLLIAQMLLLPLWLGLLLGPDAARLVHAGPFLHAFVWLIAIPLALAVLCQLWASRSATGARASEILGILPVPATALVLFIVIAAVVPQLGPALTAVIGVAPLYIVFAAVAPLVGWTVARVCRLDAAAGRAVAFSGATRNSLVVLPLALAVPGAIPLLPAVIVTQTLIELVASLVYIRVMPRLGAKGNRV